MYRKVFDRKDTFVALGSRCMDILDKATGRLLRRVQLEYDVVNDMAVHPLLPVTYLAVQAPQDKAKNPIEAKRLLEVDERTGQVKVLPRVYGDRLAADPHGRFLYASFSAYYQNGYLIDWWYGDVRPMYGTLNVLACYDVRGQEIGFQSVNLAPGEGVRGIAPALDGRAVLFIGQKHDNHNGLAAFDAQNVQQPVVSYRVTEGQDYRIIQARAVVVRVDPEEDLALLKIKPEKPVRSVCLAVGVRAESGENVTVIGHPGLGRVTLDYTMTTGIVSNPRQVLDGVSYIQTSASVNPGSSGGPLFNSRGQVIGLVVLKGRIESAGFAVPADRLEAFLKSCAAPASSPGKATSRPAGAPATAPAGLW